MLENSSRIASTEISFDGLPQPVAEWAKKQGITADDGKWFRHEISNFGDGEGPPLGPNDQPVFTLPPIRPPVVRPPLGDPHPPIFEVPGFPFESATIIPAKPGRLEFVVGKDISGDYHLLMRRPG